MRGLCLGRGLVCSLLLLCLHCFLSEAGYVIAGDDYVYEVVQDGKVCLYASFNLIFTIPYQNHSNLTEVLSSCITLPSKKNVNASGFCSHNVSELQLQWDNGTDFEATLTFATVKDKWYLNQVDFEFDFSNNAIFPDAMLSDVQTVSTNRSKWFNRTFTTKEYFYCKGCKMIQFSRCDSDSNCSACVMLANMTAPQCSEVQIEKSVMYLGDITQDRPSKRLCLEDYIALQEIIVPIVVGGVLALLLVLISVAYIIAYIRRKRKENKTAQYEPVGGDY